MPFRKWMARCLYDDNHGYYARTGVATVSKEGDFMTSVSVGPVFGRLLAERFFQFWKANDSPTQITLLEIGGHDGSLTKDVIAAVTEIDADFAKAARHVICEPLKKRRSFLQKSLPDDVRVVESATELTGEFGIIFANEVLDAYPLPLYLKSNGHWHEAAVNEDLEWVALPIDPPENIPENLPEGYVTEGTPDFRGFLEPLAGVFEKSLLLFIDYGLDEESLYHPARTAGTVRCYRKHQSNAHPLDYPGGQDLTADVNFTRLGLAAQDLGLQVSTPMNQSRYLTYCGKDWLMNAPSSAEVRQFQTLIHPAQFGNRFYAVEMMRGDCRSGFPA